jgi:hypothetical protein
MWARQFAKEVSLELFPKVPQDLGAIDIEVTVSDNMQLP